jgi:hypothetical protein
VLIILGLLVQALLNMWVVNTVDEIHIMWITPSNALFRVGFHLTLPLHLSPPVAYAPSCIGIACTHDGNAMSCKALMKWGRGAGQPATKNKEERDIAQSVGNKEDGTERNLH